MRNRKSQTQKGDSLGEDVEKGGGGMELEGW